MVKYTNPFEAWLARQSRVCEIGTNDFLAFAIGAGANVETQLAWAADPVVLGGFQAGIAPSAGFNKAFRQPSFVASCIATYMLDVLAVNNINIADNGNQLTFIMQFWQSLLGGSYFVDQGTASALLTANPFGLTFPAPIPGLRVTIKAAAACTGATTLNWMGTGNIAVNYSDGSALQSGDYGTNTILDLEYDGTSWKLMAVPYQALLRVGGKLYTFDEASPPAQPINMQVRDQVNITFESVSSIPLHVASVQGKYTVEVIFISSNTTDANLEFHANDTTQTGAWNSFNILACDTNPTALGTGGNPPTIANITSSPYIGFFAQASGNLSQNTAFIDQFSGPLGGDNINDIGSSMVDFEISTFTTAKFIKYSNGIHGGPGSGVCMWGDSVTAWTSLGTIIDEHATSFTGVAIVKRLM